MRKVFRLACALDARLLVVSAPVRAGVVALTILMMIWVCVPYVPRQYIDYSRLPLLRGIQQPETYGTDSLADMYGAKVTLNDPADMYTKRRLEQTPLEARTWSKEESAPYPPALLLTHAALYAAGERTGIGFYGMILGLACVFLGWSLIYFLKTRWYLFPLLYVNCSYFGYRFVSVQDGGYIVMLVVIMAALWLARRRHPLTHPLMALAITMKLSPLAYIKNAVDMTRGTAVLFVAILVAGLVVPYFVWENYLYIYQFHSEFKGGHWSNAAGALLFVVPFTLCLWYVETRMAFDMEDRVGWGLVPFAMFLAITMNTARHLLIVLIVPDKRGARNVVAAIGLGLHTLFPSVVRMGAVVYISAALLAVALIYYLDAIGWRTVRDDLRHPGRTVRMMLASA